jgi:hypothetical protein
MRAIRLQSADVEFGGGTPGDRYEHDARAGTGHADHERVEGRVGVAVKEGRSSGVDRSRPARRGAAQGPESTDAGDDRSSSAPRCFASVI